MKHYPKSWSRELKVALYMDDARKARLAADLERHTVHREPLHWDNVAVNVIHIPIFPEKNEMTTAEKISFLKNLAPPHALNAQSAAHSNKFDPRRMFSNASVNVVYPARDDFGDNRSNSPRDDFDEPNEHSNLGMAHDLLSCEISGESGANCGHNGVDHIQASIDCLGNYQRDQAMRDRNRDAAGRMHSVRFTA